jgi:hypothetical protein
MAPIFMSRGDLPWTQEQQGDNPVRRKISISVVLPVAALYIILSTVF